MVGVWFGAEFLEKRSTRLKDFWQNWMLVLCFKELLGKEDLLA